MSDQEAQQEPSMEEILASIRRIISEDGDEETAAAPGERECREALAEPEPKRPPRSSRGRTEILELTEEEAVLELTDEVQDDGTVVNLNTGEAKFAEEEAPDEVRRGSLEAEDEEESRTGDGRLRTKPTAEPEEKSAEPEPEPEPQPEAEPEPVSIAERRARRNALVG